MTKLVGKKDHCQLFCLRVTLDRTVTLNSAGAGTVLYDTCFKKKYGRASWFLRILYFIEKKDSGHTYTILYVRRYETICNIGYK